MIPTKPHPSAAPAPPRYLFSAIKIRPITRGDYRHDSLFYTADQRGIVLPQSLASDPDTQWAKDPYTLWNTAEFSERHPNARVAREYGLLIPQQLPAPDHPRLVLRFAQTLADRYGNAIDVAQRTPDPDAGFLEPRPYHALLLATTRKVGPRGLLEKTDAELSGRGRAARNLPLSYRDEHLAVREIWGEYVHGAMQQAGVKGQAYEAYIATYRKGHLATADASAAARQQARDWLARQQVKQASPATGNAHRPQYDRGD